VTVCRENVRKAKKNQPASSIKYEKKTLYKPVTKKSVKSLLNREAEIVAATAQKADVYFLPWISPKCVLILWSQNGRGWKRPL